MAFYSHDNIQLWAIIMTEYLNNFVNSLKRKDHWSHHEVRNCSVLGARIRGVQLVGVTQHLSWDSKWEEQEDTPDTLQHWFGSSQVCPDNNWHTDSSLSAWCPRWEKKSQVMGHILLNMFPFPWYLLFIYDIEWKLPISK